MPYLGNVPSSFNVGTDNINNDAITTAKIADGAILNADVNAAAAIAGTKISPDFGSQNILTTGTATAASLIPTSSTVPTNGLYLPAANSVAISTSGTGRLFINSAGNAVIGSSTAQAFSGFTTLTIDNATNGGVLCINKNAVNIANISAANDALTIDAANAGSSPIVFRTGVATTERLRITAAGLVGIGTSSPSANLHVAAAVSDPVLFSNTSGSAYNTAVWQNNNNLKMAVGIGGGSVGGGLSDVAYVGPISNIPLNIQTNNTARITVTAAGNVGIGTTSPSSIIHAVASTGEAVARIENTGTASAWLTLAPGSSGNGILHNVGNAATVFTTNSTERARIDSSGRLLVGTSTSGTSTGSGQFRLGGSGSEGGTVFLTNSAGSVANNGTLDITVGTSTIIIYVGFLIVHAANANTNADRTQTTFTVFGSPQNSSFTATQISTASAGANSTFTVTSPSPGVVRVTNTSGRATHISMCFMGTGWFMT